MTNATAQNTTTTTTAPAAAPTAAPAPAPAPQAQESSFNWAGTAKTIGVFALGAAAGAAGKWAWGRFFG